MSFGDGAQRNTELRQTDGRAAPDVEEQPLTPSFHEGAGAEPLNTRTGRPRPQKRYSKGLVRERGLRQGWTRHTGGENKSKDQRAR